MKLEYRNGVRISKLTHEMSPLERAIQSYEEKAEKYYSMDNPNLHFTKEEREIKKKEAMRELAIQRRHLETIGEVHALLEAYREGNMKIKAGSNTDRKKALATMKNESHHPTELLEKLMRAEGHPKPSSRHTAHHILPGSGQYEKVMIARARTHIHTHGIGINDPANGVYLLTKDEYTPHYSMPASRGHLKYHTRDYEKWVSLRIRQLTHIDIIKTQLQVIGRLLQHNEPKTAISKIKGL